MAMSWIAMSLMTGLLLGSGHTRCNSAAGRGSKTGACTEHVSGDVVVASHAAGSRPGDTGSGGGEDFPGRVVRRPHPIRDPVGRSSRVLGDDLLFSPEQSSIPVDQDL